MVHIDGTLNNSDDMDKGWSVEVAIPWQSDGMKALAKDDVTAFVVACPKDVTMYQDAVKTAGQEERLVVKDLIELVYEAL